VVKAESERELTSTLHLGLRSVVGDSPVDHIAALLEQADSEEREVIKSVINGDGNSAMVIIHRGPHKGARFLIESEGVQIGRSPENSIFLDDVTVSRKHASIAKSGSHFTFVDHGSLNGSYINNNSVSEIALKSGDEIQIGKFHLLYISADASTGEK
jgi:pSer/pThr/pTyr-binding forkhead associated (FHA) protein